MESREVDEAPHEPLDSQLVPISANKTSLVWQYFAMVKDHAQQDPVCLLLLVVPKEVPTQVPGQLGCHL